MSCDNTESSPEVEQVEQVEQAEVETTAGLTLKFTEKILRSNTNNVLTIPSLSYLNHVLSEIEFDTDIWEFEIAIRSGGTDFVKLLPAYFKHHKTIDMTPYKFKVADGDKLELVVKPKHAPSDIRLNIKYTYMQSTGMLYYQNTIRLTDIDDPTCSLMSDITQHMKPTSLELKVGEKPGDATIQCVKLLPRFKSTEFTGENYEFMQIPTEQSSEMTIDFTDDDFPIGVLNLLQYYRFEIKLNYAATKKENLDTPIHFLAYGFKVL
jgi:hypothetical protein